MNVVRFLVLLALAIWLGGLFFLPVVAQISFSGLPSPQLAGMVVRGTVIALHWIGFISGGIFLACSLIEARLTRGSYALFRPSHMIVAVMLGLTAGSQFLIIPRMERLRVAAGEVASLPAGDPVRIHFNSLHVWSTRVEGTVLVLGLVVLYLTARRFGANRG